MLIYCNRAFFRLILGYFGSVCLRLDCVTLGLAVAATAAGLQYLVDIDSAYRPELPHHFGMLMLGVVVGFSIVFRVSLAWSRYWEAVGQVHLMYSKWTDAFMQLVAFASVTVENARALGTDLGDSKAKRVEDIVEHAHRNFIIMSAIAADRLTHGDISRMGQRRREGARWSQQIVKRETLRNRKDFNSSTDLPKFEAAHVEDGVTNGHLKHDSSDERMSSYASESFGPAYSWKTFRARARPSRLEYEILKKSTDRTSVVIYWIIYDIAKLSNDLDLGAPIQSRMFQELSNGVLGFNQAIKLADVPFPFPLAQMLSLMLICFVCFIPVYVVAFTSSALAGPIISFLLFQGLWSMNETAKDLENPFEIAANGVPLGDFHTSFADRCDEIFWACTIRSGREATEVQRYFAPPPQPVVKKINHSGPVVCADLLMALTPRGTEPVRSTLDWRPSVASIHSHEMEVAANEVFQRHSQEKQREESDHSLKTENNENLPAQFNSFLETLSLDDTK